MGLWTPERALEVKLLKQKREEFIAVMAHAKQINIARSSITVMPKPKIQKQWRWTKLPDGMHRLDEVGE